MAALQQWPLKKAQKYLSIQLGFVHKVVFFNLS